MSSLGDVVLAGAVTGALAPVSFLTKPAWTGVAARLDGVTRVLAHGRDPIPKTFTQVIDLQGSLASRRITAGVRAPTHRIQRHDLRRRLRVWFKVGAPPPLVVDRYAAAARVPVSPRPWIATPRTPDEPDTLALIPGAAWATKRWPPTSWIALGRRWKGPVAVLGGPTDGALTQKIAQEISPEAAALAERGFTETLGTLARTAVAVGGDTGLLHLAAACGVPVVGLYGTTTATDGFWCHPGLAVEVPLPCRPCSRHGRIRCPIGDHACMTRLHPDQVWDAVVEVQRA